MTIESDGDGKGRVGTVVFRGNFRRVRRGRRTDLIPGKVGKAVARPGRKGARLGPRPANVAVLLAFAHHVQHMIDEGRITDRAEVARRLNWTRARISQVMNLLLLAPDIQEKVVFLEASSRLTERGLRTVVCHEVWQEQRRVWLDLLAQ